ANRAREIARAFRVERERGGDLVRSSGMSRGEARADPAVDLAAVDGAERAVEHFAIDGMAERVARGHRPVRPDRFAGVRDEAGPLREPLADPLDLVRRRVDSGGDGGDRELDADEARRVEHAPLVGGEAAE